MKRLRMWVVRRWRWSRGRCPACGGERRTVIVGMAPGTACACGFWASYAIDGSCFWNFPPPVEEDDGWFRDRIRSIAPARRSSREGGTP